MAGYKRITKIITDTRVDGKIFAEYIDEDGVHDGEVSIIEVITYYQRIIDDTYRKINELIKKKDNFVIMNENNG